MKRFIVEASIIGILVALMGCKISLTTDVKYELSGDSASVAIRYQSENGDLVDSTVRSPWFTDFHLWSSQRPFLAFIRADNNGTQNITVRILEDNSSKASTTAVAGGAAVTLYAIIE
jgi:hypothetical protein